MDKRIELPSQQELQEKFEYRDGELYSKYAMTNRRIGAKVGVLSRYGYKTATVRGIKYYVHRLIWVLLNGDTNGKDIDHINGNRSDNRIGNLRLVTKKENNQNLHGAKKHSVTGVLGVSPKHNGRYVAQIQMLGKYTYLGMFRTIDEAKEVYLEAKRAHHTGYVEGCPS